MANANQIDFKDLVASLGPKPDYQGTGWSEWVNQADQLLTQAAMSGQEVINMPNMFKSDWNQLNNLGGIYGNIDVGGGKYQALSRPQGKQGPVVPYWKDIPQAWKDAINEFRNFAWSTQGDTAARDWASHLGGTFDPAGDWTGMFQAFSGHKAAEDNMLNWWVHDASSAPLAKDPATGDYYTMRGNGQFDWFDPNMVPMGEGPSPTSITRPVPAPTITGAPIDYSGFGGGSYTGGAPPPPPPPPPPPTPPNVPPGGPKDHSQGLRTFESSVYGNTSNTPYSPIDTTQGQGNKPKPKFTPYGSVDAQNLYGTK